MAITYNAGTDTITVTAGTAGVPNTFTDIYNADIAGGWGGRWTKTGNMHVCNANLQVGDGSTATHLYDTFKKVTINKPWTVKNNATLKTGIQDAGHPRKGCFLVLNTTAATAITVESGGTFYQYQTPTEDTGVGVNAISGATEDFYRGVQVLDLKGAWADQHFGIGLVDNTAKARVLESIIPYIGLYFLAVYDPILVGWRTPVIVEPGVGYSIKFGGPDVTLIVDHLIDGEYYNTIFPGGIITKFRFDIPAGGGGLLRNPPMTGGMV